MARLGSSSHAVGVAADEDDDEDDGGRQQDQKASEQSGDQYRHMSDAAAVVAATPARSAPARDDGDDDDRPHQYGQDGDPPAGGDGDGDAATRSSSAHHVDIVSYPSSNLLRLLAALLEQIAHANDERNARVAAAAGGGGGGAGPSNSIAAEATTPEAAATVARSQGQGGDTEMRSADASQAESDWRKGRFDAAPLNSPITPRHRRRFSGGSGGPGILDNALEHSSRDENGTSSDEEEGGGVPGDEMPLTPGMDLLRETASGAGVEGFMPSLGGTHQPQPLSRRRGSSFLRNKRNDDGTIPLATRRAGGMSGNSGGGSSNGIGGAPPPPASSAGSNLPGSSRPGTAPTPSSSATGPAVPRPPLAAATPPGTSTTPTGSSPSTTVQNETPMSSLLTASAVAFSSPNATLCFHARNVPSISIEAYLQRILKYCPTTNEVFLALLVYFDRMARIGLEAQRLGLPKDQPQAEQDASSAAAAAAAEGPNMNKLFAIDSFNVHRLVIAGVTVASKFFSDVFYTNSRYAKVSRDFPSLEGNSGIC